MNLSNGIMVVLVVIGVITASYIIWQKDILGETALFYSTIIATSMVILIIYAICYYPLVFMEDETETSTVEYNVEEIKDGKLQISNEDESKIIRDFNIKVEPKTATVKEVTTKKKISWLSHMVVEEYQEYTLIISEEKQ